MGCDIHVYIEYRAKGSERKHWSDFGGRINPGRSYLLFGIMSKGVRTKPTFSFDAKGMPEDAGHESLNDNRKYIGKTESEDSVTLETAQRWASHGCTITNNENGEPLWVSHPDWHSHSWLTTEEFQKVMDFYNENANPYWIEIEYEAILACMKKFEEKNYESRIVFWFDN